MGSTELNTLVLAGGPDREREVSLQSGAEVAAALHEAGHVVRESDIGPDNLSALDACEERGEVIFPVLHGGWGEGGGMQAVLDQRGLRYVGARQEAAALCMNKFRTKAALCDSGIATPDFQWLDPQSELTLEPPLVLKPICEGSSIDIIICRTPAEVAAAREQLFLRHESLLAESFIAGEELTVGIIELPGDDGRLTPTALPPLRIVPRESFYDYHAKYERDDTQYLFDTGLSQDAARQLQAVATRVHGELNARHLSRVDFIIDAQGQAWVLEINTMPGFTTHSLLPRAAARHGLAMPRLVDHLVRLAAES